MPACYTSGHNQWVYDMKPIFKNSAHKDAADIQIFLDMDGVISDFDRHCTETGLRRTDGSPAYDRMTTSEWYSTMCVFDGARAFYDDLCKFGHVRFLTAPIKYPECFSGKAQWIKSFVPEQGRMILGELMIVASKDKQLVAGPGRVLIDDSEKNVNEWKAAGGIGILHKGDYKQTLQTLQKEIQNYRVQKTKRTPKP